MTRFIFKEGAVKSVTRQMTPLVIGLLIGIGVLTPAMYFWGRYNGYKAGYSEGQLAVPMTNIDIVMPAIEEEAEIHLMMYIYIFKASADTLLALSGSDLLDYIVEFSMFSFNTTTTKQIPLGEGYSFAIIGVAWNWDTDMGDYDVREDEALIQNCGGNYTYELFLQPFDEGDPPFFWAEFSNAEGLIRRDNTWYEYRLSPSFKINLIEMGVTETYDAILEDVDLWCGDFDNTAPFVGFMDDGDNPDEVYLVFGYTVLPLEVYDVFISANAFDLGLDLNENHILLIMSLTINLDLASLTAVLSVGSTNYAYSAALIPD